MAAGTSSFAVNCHNPRYGRSRKYPELQSRPKAVLNALALAVSGNDESGNLAVVVRFERLRSHDFLYQSFSGLA